MENKLSKSKEVILTRVRESQVLARLPEIMPESTDGLKSHHQPESDLLNSLQKEFDLLGVETYVEKNQKAVCKRLRNLLQDKSVLSWNLDNLPYDAGTVLQSRNVYFERDDKIIQASADIGLTGCDAAIAETGSLVLLSGEGKPRTASLLPFEHIALIRQSDIYFTMSDFFDKKGKEVSQASCIDIITGPSRTADIELSLTLGVHGPGKVIVVIGP
ncbi:LUD domain-containing protein [candidate division KSB1 bacterium]|nr:LUD domain-containing protein [candidate division KSB1 bacterium]